MLRSLGLKLLLMCLLVLSVAIGIMVLFNSQATSGEFVRYLDTKTSQDQVMINQILDAYNRNPDPTAIKSLVIQKAKASGRRLILTDKNQVVLADSSGELNGQVLETPGLMTKKAEPADFLIPIPSGVDAQMATQVTSQVTIFVSTDTPRSTFGVIGNSINSVYGSGPMVSAQVTGPEKSYINSVNRWQWLAVALAGLVTVGLAIFLSRQILRPVRALTLAARQLEKGDLSQRVKVKSHDEIGELAHAFNAMADSLARSEQLRRNMVSDVAHELRTPLTNISGYLEALQDRVARPTPEIFASLYEEARLLNRLVSDLQELALAEAGQLKLFMRDLDVHPVINGAVAAVKSLAADKGLEVRAELPSDLPEVEADAERLGQILRNLLNNAIQHTPETGRVTVGARVVEMALEITVQDSGVGIEPEHLLYLFERFYRVDRARSRATGGSGLGLAIVKQLVEAHGGNVSVTSQPGQGTSFSFTIQLATSKVSLPQLWAVAKHEYV